MARNSTSACDQFIAVVAQRTTRPQRSATCQAGDDISAGRAHGCRRIRKHLRWTRTLATRTDACARKHAGRRGSGRRHAFRRIMNTVRHDEFPLRSPPRRSESAARRQHGTAAANTTHRELSTFMQTQPHSVWHMTRRMACMRRTLMHGSRCAAVSSGAVGRQPHGASRRVTVGAGSHMHASRVQRAADSVSRTTAATTHRRPREQTCDGAVRARWRRAAGRQRAAQRTAGRVAHWLAGWPRARVGWGGAEGEGGTMHG